MEFVGNFPNIKGRCWKPKEFGCHQVTPEQIAAGRSLIRHLVDTFGLRYVFAHRQSSATRENDPGPDLWAGVGQWAVDQLKLSDGGTGYKIGSGNPIPVEWRTWGATSQEAELTSGSSGTEAAMERSAVRGGERNENALTDLVFYARHPERGGRPLARGEPGFSTLSAEWLRIRDTLVRPALRGGSTPAPAPAPAPGGGGGIDVVSRCAVSPLRARSRRKSSGCSRPPRQRGCD